LISARTVGRILKERPPRRRPPEAQAPPTNHAVRASFPNHVFLIDLTDIPSFFGLFTFKLAVVLDVFSRFPVAARLFLKEPTAADLAHVLHQTTARHPAPKHLVSDQGSQFTSKLFRDAARFLGLRHRFGAIGKVGSIAILERFWKTLKQILCLRAFPPLFCQDLNRRLELGLQYYAFFKPHQGLHGATPAEVYFGLDPAHLRAIPPPRARPGEGPTDPLFLIESLGNERRFPVLVKAA